MVQRLSSTELTLSAPGELDPQTDESLPLLPEDEIEARRLWVWLATEAADRRIAAYDAAQAAPLPRTDSPRRPEWVRRRDEGRLLAKDLTGSLR